MFLSLLVILYVVIGTGFVFKSLRILKEEGEELEGGHVITVLLVGLLWPIMTLLVMLRKDPSKSIE